MAGGFGSLINSFPLRLRLILKILYPPAPFVNIIPSTERDKIRKKIFSGGHVIDVGSGISRGPGGWLWLNIDRKSYSKLDILDHQDIDIVASATEMPLTTASVDSIILQSVPEHIEDIQKLFDETHRVLKTGGYLYIEMPFLQGLHGDPYDYWRCTPAAIDFLMRNKFKLVLSGPSSGPIGALIWITTDLLSNLSRCDIFNKGIRFTLRWLMSPFRYLDFMIRKTSAANRLASENYFLFQKIK